MRNGVCTMSPSIGQWVSWCVGRDTGSDRSRTMITMKLKDLADALHQKGFLKEDLHRAGTDAQLHRLVFIALKRLHEQGA